MKTRNDKRLEIRAERLDFLEKLDYIIKNLAMSDGKREKLKELRGNSCRYTLEQLKLKFDFIINN
jgi:hypothetical protein